MRRDHHAHLADAARRRHELTRAKAVQALRELDRAGTAVTFEKVARDAGVSRSWLYTEPDIRAEIERLRDATRRTTTQIPVSQRASDASLRARLNAVLERNRKLTEENQRLHRQLAHALGEGRESPSPRRASITIGPC
jgi:signal transduction protein with GAF and PtsI domain